MSFSKKRLIIIALAIIEVACGEVSYKRGASVRDIESAHKACRGVPESAFSDCLQKQGWEVQKFDDSELFAETSVTDNRGTPPAKHEKTMEEELQETAQPRNSVERATPATATSKTQSETSVADTKPTPSPMVKPAPAPVDPLKTYKINSWWKFGGTPAQLKADQTSCVTTLGEAHQPDMATQTYTRGLIECLHKNGWKALKAVK